jgi:hypothetical protein
MPHQKSSLTPHFKSKVDTPTVKSGGPTKQQQLEAIAKGENWTIVNLHLLRDFSADKLLCHKANVFKQLLQTFGPNSNKLPDLRNNTGNAHNHVFHGHIKVKTTYVLEWSVVDNENRIIALLGFSTHENYAYKQEPLSVAEKQNILKHHGNQVLIARGDELLEKAEEKIAKLNKQYRNA